MAAVIHSLWEKGDKNPLILPANIPIAVYIVGGVFNSNNTLTRVATFGHAQRLNRRNTDGERKRLQSA